MNRFEHEARKEQKEYLGFFQGVAIGVAISTVLWVFGVWAVVAVWS